MLPSQAVKYHIKAPLFMARVISQRVNPCPRYGLARPDAVFMLSCHCIICQTKHVAFLNANSITSIELNKRKKRQPYGEVTFEKLGLDTVACDPCTRQDADI
jgi:hypothetical protein